MLFQNYFEDLEIGQSIITPTRTMTEADVVLFAGLTGDYNELHTSEYFNQKHTQFGQKVTYVTERAVFELDREGIILKEIAPGVDLQKDILDKMEFEPIIEGQVQTMSNRLFRPERMGLKEAFFD